MGIAPDPTPGCGIAHMVTPEPTGWSRLVTSGDEEVLNGMTFADDRLPTGG